VQPTTTCWRTENATSILTTLLLCVIKVRISTSSYGCRWSRMYLSSRPFAPICNNSWISLQKNARLISAPSQCISGLLTDTHPRLSLSTFPFPCIACLQHRQPHRPPHLLRLQSQLQRPKTRRRVKTLLRACRVPCLDRHTAYSALGHSTVSTPATTATTTPETTSDTSADTESVPETYVNYS